MARGSGGVWGPEDVRVFDSGFRGVYFSIFLALIFERSRGWGKDDEIRHTSNLIYGSNRSTRPILQTQGRSPICARPSNIERSSGRNTLHSRIRKL